MDNKSVLKKIKKIKRQTEETLLDAFSLVRELEKLTEIKTYF